MRYKVKARTAVDFGRLREAVAASTHVFAVSERRLTLSIGEVDERVRERIRQLGGTIQPEHRYVPEIAIV